MGLLDLPQDQRPRERLLASGHEALSDAELIATLLGTGIRGATAIDLARELLANYGDLSTLQRAEPADLANRRGLGTAKACALVAALELGRRAQRPRSDRPRMKTAADVNALLAPRIAHLAHEVFVALCLDAKNRVLREARIADGGLASVTVLPREAFAPALREGATAVVFAHNHPSGDPEPSNDDLRLTRTLWEAGRVLSVPVLDHVVVGDGRFVSLSDRGFLDGR
jgi:DNA repair protein RadC